MLYIFSERAVLETVIVNEVAVISSLKNHWILFQTKSDKYNEKYKDNALFRLHLYMQYYFISICNLWLVFLLIIVLYDKEVVALKLFMYILCIIFT